MQIILLLLSFFSTKTYIIDANTNYLKSNIIINKTDINNDGIASATFNLYKDNKIINTYKTDDNGRIILSLDNGKYTLKETTKTTWFKLEKINLNVENKDLTINFKSKRIKPCGIRIINFDDNDYVISFIVNENFPCVDKAYLKNIIQIRIYMKKLMHIICHTEKILLSLMYVKDVWTIFLIDILRMSNQLTFWTKSMKQKNF